jgi:hypothetical protein
MPKAYRVDESPNNRAGCQQTQHKKEGVKITKGELRFATMITIQEHDSWQYRHWSVRSEILISKLRY